MVDVLIEALQTLKRERVVVTTFPDDPAEDAA